MHSNSRRARFAWAKIAVFAVTASVLLGGCGSDTVRRGFLPGYSDGEVTNHTGRITALWNGSWIAALAVGVLTWGLILWCVAVYRKRRDDHVLPVQVKYHLPMEIMYTALPIIMVGVLFYYTDRDLAVIKDTSGTPDVTIEVIGKQWSWDFNYVDADVYDTGQHTIDVGSLTAADTIDGARGTATSLPTLYLPVNEKVKFNLRSRDVIHSFWVPAFLYKQDMFPFRTNTFMVTPLRVGAYAGKCAELCGEEHSGMLFNVKVVPKEEFDQHMDDLRAKGQEGQLPVEGLSRIQDPDSTSQDNG